MHEMLTIVTDVRGVCLSVRLSVTRLKSAAARAVYAVCGHLVQPLSNYFDHLLLLSFITPQRQQSSNIQLQTYIIKAQNTKNTHKISYKSEK